MIPLKFTQAANGEGGIVNRYFGCGSSTCPNVRVVKPQFVF